MQLSKTDELYSVQCLLWRHIGLDATARPADLQQADVPTCLAAARAICLQTSEVQQLLHPDDIQRPLNPRNEAAALALLLANQQSVCGSAPDRQQQLQALLAAYPSSSACDNSSLATGVALGQHKQQQQQQQQEQQQQIQQGQQLEQPQSFAADSPELVLYRWALEQGATAGVTPAIFPTISPADRSDATPAAAISSSSSCTQNAPAEEAGAQVAGGLRGCAAAADMEAGCVVMSVPAKLLITYDTAAESDFGKALSRLPGLDPETLAVIWTMVDRHEPESPHAPFWSALPDSFGTGLSAPQPLLDLIKGVPLYQECMDARVHVRQQFAALQQTFEVLLTAYKAYLQPAWFTLDAYLWAVELWYAYAIQVKLPHGNVKPALVPLASLINHSPAPHIVHFSTVNPKTRRLQLKSFRPVQQHQQVFLSYGPLPNSQLLLFYGFALPGNPFEQQQLMIQPEQLMSALQQQQQQGLPPGQRPKQQQEQEGWSSSQLLATKVQLLHDLDLASSYTLTAQQPLPPGLLHSLRLLCCSTTELQQLQQAVQQYRQQASGSTSSTPGPSTAGKGSAVRKAKSKATGKVSGTQGSDGITAESMQQRWAAVVEQAAVLGGTVSARNEAAVQAVLQQLQCVAKQPYEACLAKLRKRQQLQAMLAGQGKQVQADEAAFAAVLGVYLQGVLGVFDACGAAADRLC